MKKVCLVFCFILIGSGLFAQKTKTIRGIANLDPYVGTWVYQSNDTIFKIVLQKSRLNILDVTFLGLGGSYSLSVGGNVIDNYIGPLPDSITSLQKYKLPDNWCIWANNTDPNNSSVTPSYMGLYFYDKRKKHFDGNGISGGTLQLLSPCKMLWRLDEKWAIWFATEGSDKVIEPIGFSVPEHAIMVKEE